ncbi:hypothetical protein [Vibrio hippocampi]|uniref:Lysyl-tRNA synthetase n=1 Tax=Vibrio hippocampi TaxID=654686 RepID=A0ABN8DJ42_9VIBR|nr:hypothetical protein [Vibrio hippocampi]CAH0526800.1 hypothetical protein VHP8226_02176 [Vibrio hippocampi]
MQKHQLDQWLRGEYKDSQQPPKVFVIGCADISHYLLAVEYKHKLEPILDNEHALEFDSIDSVKETLYTMGLQKAYLRLHRGDRTDTSKSLSDYYDIELSLY